MANPTALRLKSAARARAASRKKAERERLEAAKARQRRAAAKRKAKLCAPAGTPKGKLKGRKYCKPVKAPAKVPVLRPQAPAPAATPAAPGQAIGGVVLTPAPPSTPVVETLEPTVPTAPTPTASPSPDLTAIPSPDPTASPSPDPTASPSPAPTPVTPSSPFVYDGPFTAKEASRLLWRAAFGPVAGQAEQLAQLGLEQAVHSLTRPVGEPTLHGPAGSDHGEPLEPDDRWSHTHLDWLDRMIRTDQPLRERMALIWHDWFPTSMEGVSRYGLVNDQIQMYRDHFLGSFDQLVHKVTADPAMLQFLDGTSNSKYAPNENYARELMELFTLGADRGAYTEHDVRELARALTGFGFDWSPTLGVHNFRFIPSRHDTGLKTVFGLPPAPMTPQDAVTACLEHPMHASFFVGKLWSAFVPTSPSPETVAHLERVYVEGGRSVRPVVEAILTHPDLYRGETMVKPPAVFCAGLYRARGVEMWGGWGVVGGAMDAGQLLGYPPNVSGWDERRWLDTSRWRGRWLITMQAAVLDTLTDGNAYPADETAEEAVAKALKYWGSPPMSDQGLEALLAFARTVQPGRWPRLFRMNALRLMVGTSPDNQVC